MKNFGVVLLIGALISTPALADQWQAKDHATIAIYGTPLGEEYEAFLGSPDGQSSEECTPAQGRGRVIADMYCAGDDLNKPPEQVTKANGGVMFRGKFYATE
jgi:hypothetical protein